MYIIALYLIFLVTNSPALLGDGVLVNSFESMKSSYDRMEAIDCKLHSKHGTVTPSLSSTATMCTDKDAMMFEDILFEVRDIMGCLFKCAESFQAHVNGIQDTQTHIHAGSMPL